MNSTTLLLVPPLFKKILFVTACEYVWMLSDLEGDSCLILIVVQWTTKTDHFNHFTCIYIFCLLVALNTFSVLGTHQPCPPSEGFLLSQRATLSIIFSSPLNHLAPTFSGSFHSIK